MKFDSIIELFKAGGIVSYPLLVFSILAVALILERIMFWSKLKRNQERIIKEMFRHYRAEPEAAIRKLKQNADLPICRIFIEALELENPNSEEFRLALESATQAEIPTLKRYNNLFETIIAASPLFGLLGTVLGLIRSFASLNLGNVGGTQTAGVTGGISEALVSTAAGLVVALVTMLFANTFRGFYTRELALIQEYGGQLELLYRRLYEKGEQTYATTR
ncbi:MAG: MotA/TolQ/ExbB proton channel family protein [Waterburya sp.]